METAQMLLCMRKAALEWLAKGMAKFNQVSCDCWGVWDQTFRGP